MGLSMMMMMMICWFAKIKCWFYYEIHFLRSATPRFKEFEDWSVSSFVKLASVSCVAPEVLHTTRKPSTRKYEPHFQANYSFSEEAISSAKFPEPFAWHLNMHTLRAWCTYVDMTVCVAGDWKMRTRALSVDEREADEFWKHDNLRICSLLASNFFFNLWRGGEMNCFSITPSKARVFMSYGSVCWRARENAKGRRK